jgi:anti-sigma factor RsiW
MACDLRRGKIEAYADAELSADEMRAMGEHLRGCASCTSDLLGHTQLKRAIHTAGERFSPSSTLRERVEKTLPRRRSAKSVWYWVPILGATAAIIVLGFLALQRWSASQREQVYAELADLHVAALASSNPVDIISTDRHTVKPWFQGRIPFTFNLPELASTPFTLEGGRVSYLDQSPGAQLIFKIGNHRISVFIFQNRLDRRFTSSDSQSKRLTFNVETWTENDLRYFAIGDANAEDIHKLSELLRNAARS